MSQEKLLQADRKAAYDAVVRFGGSKTKAANYLNVPRTTISHRYHSYMAEFHPELLETGEVPHPVGSTDSVEVEENQDTAHVRISVEHKLSSEEILDMSGLEKKFWRLVSHKRWTTSMKIRSYKDGVPKDTPTVVWNYHYTFERMAPKAVQESVEQIVAGWKPPPLPQVSHSSADADHLVEIDLCDAHFGKLCYDETSSEKTYDLEEAAHLFVQSVGVLRERISGYPAQRYLLPIGNDFFHIDNWGGTTTRGTPVSRNEQISKIFLCGFEALASSIQLLLESAPVDMVWVPGNHDLNTSWHLFVLLKERFSASKHVTSDVGTKKRQYYDYGHNVICFQHGEKMKPEKMVAVAASEFLDWSRKRFREIHCGHRHTAMDFKFLQASEYNGCMVRYLSSLSATDEWHYDNGFVGNKRAAEAIAWHPEEGPVGTARTFIN